MSETTNWLPLITLWIIGGLSLLMCLISICMILWINKTERAKKDISKKVQTA